MAFPFELVADGKVPVYIVEPEGDVSVPLSDPTDWGPVGDTPAVTTFANAKRGAPLSLEVVGAGAGALLGLESSAPIGPWDGTRGAYSRLWVFVDDLTGVTELRVREGSSPLNYREWSIDPVAAGLTDASNPDTQGWNHLYLSRLTQQPQGYTLAVVGVPFDIQSAYVRVELDKPAAAPTVMRISALTRDPWRYSTGKVIGQRAPTKWGWLQDPKIGQHRTNPKDGTLTGAAASIRIVDDGGDGMPWGSPWGNPWSGHQAVIQDLQAFGFDGRQVTVYWGFQPDAEDQGEFRPLFRGFIDDTRHLGRAWEFPVGDNLRLFRVPFARNATDATPLVVTGTIKEVLLTLALSTGTGANDPTWDILPAGDGAGIPADLFDLVEIVSELDTWAPLDQVSFEFREPEDSFLAWVFKQICKPHAVVPKVKADGRLSFTVVHPAFAGLAAPQQVNSTNVIIARGLPGFRQNREDIVNSIRLQYDYDPVADEYLQDITVSNAESVARYGERFLPIQSKGIRTQFVAERAVDRLLERFSDGNPPVDVDTHMSLQPVELGDLVLVTLEGIVPDIEEAVYSLVEVFCEVDGRGLDPSAAINRLRLGVTSFRQERYAVINCVATDFDASTPEEQEIGAFISCPPPGNEIDATTEGWVIAPG